MDRTIIITIEDHQRTQEDIDAVALKLIDSIQETHLNGIGLRISRPGRFYIKADILQSAPDVIIDMS